MIAILYVILFRACRSSTCEYLRESSYGLDAQDPTSQDTALQVVPGPPFSCMCRRLIRACRI